MHILDNYFAICLFKYILKVVYVIYVYFYIFRLAYHDHLYLKFLIYTDKVYKNWMNFATVDLEVNIFTNIYTENV